MPQNIYKYPNWLQNVKLTTIENMKLDSKKHYIWPSASCRNPGKGQSCTMSFRLYSVKVGLLWNIGFVEVVGERKGVTHWTPAWRAGDFVAGFVGLCKWTMVGFSEGVWQVIKESLGSILLACVV